MNTNSLFAVLLRSPWWISFAVAVGIFALARLALPEAYALYGIFAALPFLVYGIYAAWQQLRAPSAERSAARLESLRSMYWDEFSRALEDAFRRDGYSASPSDEKRPPSSGFFSSCLRAIRRRGGRSRR